MSEWKCYKLSEISSLSNGINFDKSAYTSGVKLIGVSDFKNRIHPDYDSLQEVDSKVVKSGDYLEKGDIVFVRSNGNKELVGRCMIIDRDIPVTYSGFCINLRLKDKKRFEPVFFNYLFKTRQFKKSMTGTAVGANIQNLSQSRLGNCEINVPDIETQKRIATILSRYDSLIENYQKQIKLLEEAAQRLYKEWFVDLRFPGHENTNIVDGVPEGWEKKKLIDLVDVQYGYAFDGHLFNSKEEGTPIVRIRNIPDGYTNDYTTEEVNESYIINDGDILVGMDGIFHINTWSGGKAFLVQRACSFRPKDDSMKGFILQAIYEPIKFFENTVVGATVAHLGKKHIDSIELLVSKNVSLYKPFEKKFNERQTLKSQLRLLTEARDRLLPKLMSGEIEI